MIRRAEESDFPEIQAVINDGASKYRGEIPAEHWHEPYMSGAAFNNEIAAGVEFWVWDSGEILGAMGIQRVRDATLIRHAYVRTIAQGQGLGSKLLGQLSDAAEGRLLVGTWAAARWAIGFYQRNGFRLIENPEKDRLLDTYWSIPISQRDVSVVLEYAPK